MTILMCRRVQVAYCPIAFRSAWNRLGSSRSCHETVRQRSPLPSPLMMSERDRSTNLSSPRNCSSSEQKDFRAFRSSGSSYVAVYLISLDSRDICRRADLILDSSYITRTQSWMSEIVSYMKQKCRSGFLYKSARCGLHADRLLLACYKLP